MNQPEVTLVDGRLYIDKMEVPTTPSDPPNDVCAIAGEVLTMLGMVASVTLTIVRALASTEQ